MHASVWKFAGDPDDLLRRYEAIIAEIPIGSMLIHLCLRAPDGIVVIDTCASEEIFHAFASGGFPALRAKHGLADPERVDDYPVHTAFVDGQRTLMKLRGYTDWAPQTRPGPRFHSARGLSAKIG